MKRPLLFVLLFLLVGCAAPQPQETEEFNISLHDASHSEKFSPDLNKTMDTISFVIRNNEVFALDCYVILSLDNQTNKTASKGTVGLLEPGEQKQVSLTFEMLYGTTDLKVEPSCRKP